MLGRLMLQKEQLDISAGEDERYEMVIAVATGQMDVDAIKEWLSTHVKSI